MLLTLAQLCRDTMKRQELTIAQMIEGCQHIVHVFLGIYSHWGCTCSDCCGYSPAHVWHAQGSLSHNHLLHVHGKAVSAAAPTPTPTPTPGDS